MVATDMCEKRPSRESGYMGLCENVHSQQFCSFLTFSSFLNIIITDISLFYFHFVYLIISITIIT